MKLKVNEIFYSIQGESLFAGLPFVFVRLTGCNLRCSYCDTTYAYEEGREFEIDEIVSEVSKYDCSHVEITGGEPLLQSHSPVLAEKLVKMGKIVMVETNGSLDISVLEPPVIRIVDVKCPGSGEEGSFLRANLQHLRKEDNLKFVISDRDDFDWALNFVQQNKLLEKCPILFSPAFSRMDPRQLAEWIKSCGLPIRLQIQLHKIIWNPNERGV